MGVTVTGDDERPTGATGSRQCGSAQTAEDARTLALAAAADLAVFFALILLGFAYVWRRGDLDWVRAIDTSQSRPARKLQVSAVRCNSKKFTND